VVLGASGSLQPLQFGPSEGGELSCSPVSSQHKIDRPDGDRRGNEP